MTSLQAWLTKPRIGVRINTSLPSIATPGREATWPHWMKALRRQLAGKQAEERARIEVLDRLALGGKKSLLLVSIEGQRLLIGVGEDAAPSVSSLDALRATASSRVPTRPVRMETRRTVRR